MSVNGGAWIDIGVGGVNSYNGTILNQGATSNPLGGRAGFVQNSPGTVHTTLTQAIAPGSTVQVRFRLGSDQIFGAAGWNVDNISFTGVVETPFDTVVADPGCVPPSTTVTLVSNTNPSPFAANLTLTATVASLSGPPSGSVTFFDGATNLGTAPVVSGVANLVTSTLATGAHSLTASYAGDFGPATSAPFAQTINKAVSATDVVSSLDPTTVGQPVTFTATISGAVGTPTGTVTFLDGATPLGAKALDGGNEAELTTSAVSCGTRTIHANYGGSATYATSTDSLVQTVFNPTAPAASNTGPYCDGGTIQLSTPDVPGATYAWAGPNGFSSTNREPTLPATAAAAGIYQVRVTLAGCTTVPGSTTVVVNATPATPTASNGGPYCEGSTIQLSTPAVAGATYSWTGPNGFTSTDQNPTRPNATTADAGIYSVTVTLNSCPSAPGTTTVVVNATPATPTATNTGPYCEGATISLSTPTVAGATYAWTGPNGFTSSDQNPTRPNATPADAGIYAVTVTVAGCTSAAGNTTVVVNATPATPTASNGGPYCEGATISLSTPTVTGATYAWTGPNGFTSSDQNPTRPNATLADAGIYSVTVTVDGCPSAAAGTTTVVVNSVPATPTATNGGPYIEGDTIALSTPLVAGATYAWTGPNGFSSSDREPTIPSATLAAAGTYSVTVTVDGCTSAAGTTDVIVGPAGNYFALTPCRLLDTRQAGQGPPLSSGVPRILAVTGSCGVPANAIAVAINVTVVPTASGHIAAYPGDQALPPTSMLNFNAGLTRANNGIIPLASDSSGTLAFRAVILDGGTAHLIVDVMGYFTLDTIVPSSGAAGRGPGAPFE